MSAFQNPAHQTAFHESGHAVAALHFGVRFEAVELNVWAKDGNWYCNGRLRGAPLPEHADNRRLWAQLVVVMAGYAAVSLIEQQAGFSIRAFTFPDDRDYNAAAELLGSMKPAVVEERAVHAAMEQAWSDARQVVGTHVHALRTIAAELMRLSHPNGETVACQLALTPLDLSKLLPATS